MPGRPKLSPHRTDTRKAIASHRKSVVGFDRRHGSAATMRIPPGPRPWTAGNHHRMRRPRLHVAAGGAWSAPRPPCASITGPRSIGRDPAAEHRVAGSNPFRRVRPVKAGVVPIDRLASAFRRDIGTSPAAFVEQLRVEAASQTARNALTVAAIDHQIGIRHTETPRRRRGEGSHKWALRHDFGGRAPEPNCRSPRRCRRLVHERRVRARADRSWAEAGSLTTPESRHLEPTSTSSPARPTRTRRRRSRAS
jgi:hypothetical protein